jgi:hypothetical protein
LFKVCLSFITIEAVQEGTGIIGAFETSAYYTLTDSLPV